MKSIFTFCFSQCPGRASLYHNWGRPIPQAVWNRRSSWNSLGRPTRGVGVGGGGGGGVGGGGGSLRLRGPQSYLAEQESLLSPPPLHLPPHLLSRHLYPRRERRAYSLELPELLQVPPGLTAGGAPLLPLPPLHAHPPRKKSFSEGVGIEHQDCNGKTPLSAQQRLLTEVYPQVNTRKDREDLDDELDYVSVMY